MDCVIVRQSILHMWEEKMKRIGMLLMNLLFLCSTVSVHAISFAVPVSKPQRNICLMYHRLSVNPLDWGAFCTSPDVFENDLKT